MRKTGGHAIFALLGACNIVGGTHVISSRPFERTSVKPLDVINNVLADFKPVSDDNVLIATGATPYSLGHSNATEDAIHQCQQRCLTRGLPCTGFWLAVEPSKRNQTTCFINGQNIEPGLHVKFEEKESGKVVATEVINRPPLKRFPPVFYGYGRAAGCTDQNCDDGVTFDPDFDFSDSHLQRRGGSPAQSAPALTWSAQCMIRPSDFESLATSFCESFLQPSAIVTTTTRTAWTTTTSTLTATTTEQTTLEKKVPVTLRETSISTSTTFSTAYTTTTTSTMTESAVTASANKVRQRRGEGNYTSSSCALPRITKSDQRAHLSSLCSYLNVTAPTPSVTVQTISTKALGTDTHTAETILTIWSTVTKSKSEAMATETHISTITEIELKLSPKKKLIIETSSKSTTTAASTSTAGTTPTTNPDEAQATSLLKYVCNPECDVDHWCNNGICQLRDYYKKPCLPRAPCGDDKSGHCYETVETVDLIHHTFCTEYDRCTGLSCFDSGECPGSTVCLIGVCLTDKSGVCSTPETGLQ